MACQAFRAYEMIILFRLYGTLAAYIMQHGGKAHGPLARWPTGGVYIMNARARCIYRTNALCGRACWFGAKFARAF